METGGPAVGPPRVGQDTCADRIGTITQLVRDVSVKALDAVWISPRWGAGIVDAFVSVATSAVAGDRVREACTEVVILDQARVQLAHETRRFKSTGAFDQHGTRQPEQRGERRAVVEPWVVLDRHRDAKMAVGRDGPAAAQRPAQLSLDYESLLIAMYECHKNIVA